MAAPTKTPATGEIGDLTLDDLLAPLPETVRLGGPGPFVINLSTSATPIDMPAKTIAGSQLVHVYQVQRTEDRRPRYRLRLGPFAHEDAADAALKKARDVYPGALTATADADDLRAIATTRAKAQALLPPAQKPAAAPRPVPSAASISIGPPLLPSALSSAAPRVVSPSTAPAAPLALLPAAPAVRSSAPPVVASSVVPPAAVSPPPAGAKPLDVEGGQASRWFAIQLSLAEEPFDPDTVPDLDIFSVYRLYSVAGIDQGRIVHALRLGFFTEEIAAGAVASYLAAFYDKPAIKRVSSAERQRFAEQPLAPRKDVGTTGKQAVIEITSERYIRDRRGGQA
jgi:SPOR domain